MVKVEEIKTQKEFLDKGTFLVTKDNKGFKPPQSYLILNYDKVEELEKEIAEFRKKHGQAYGYTLQDVGGQDVILVKGFVLVNRMGYYVTVEDFKLKDDQIDM